MEKREEVAAEETREVGNGPSGQALEIPNEDLRLYPVGHG